jgi:hypothetical protein
LFALEAGRIMIGAVAWVAPRTAGRLLGLGSRPHPHTAFVTRIAGARDIALGVGALAVRDEARAPLLAIGVASDALDAVAGALALRERVLPPAAALLAGGSGAAAALAGLALLRDARRAERR